MPEKYNKFTGTMDKGQNVKFKILTSNGAEMAQNGSFASEYTMYGSAKFSFTLNNAWLEKGNIKYSRVRLINASGDVLADFYRNQDAWDPDKQQSVPSWTGTSEYIRLSGIDNSSWDKTKFTLDLSGIASDVTVELTAKVDDDSSCSYEVTANDLGTPEKTNVTPVPDKDAIPSGEVFLWKQITLTADNNWSNAVSLEENDIKGNKYYLSLIHI